MSNLREMVRTPGLSSINSGLSPADHATMIALFGVPGAKTRDCSSQTGRVRARIITAQVGPLRVTGHSTAIASLKFVVRDAIAATPELATLLGTEGMSCCRLVRGSTTHFSNHSWGTGIDLTIGGILPPFNASWVPRGFLALYPHFHRYGWFWAAGYHGRTDPMHFEIAQQTLLRWRAQGMI